jgi:hypothetical protein
MELQRIKIGVYLSAKFVRIPHQCVDARTITLNKMNVLSCYKDRRPFAVEYMSHLFPALGVPQPDKLLKWFYEEMPDNSFLEMDYGTRTLSLCLVEKK